MNEPDASILSESPPGSNADVGTCDAEPIHTPSAVQPPGVLLVVRESDLEIVQASANAGARLGWTGPVLGARLSAVLPSGLGGGLASVLRETTVGVQPKLIPAGPSDPQPGLEATVHRRGPVLVVELMPAAGTRDDLYRVATQSFQLLSDASSIDDLCTVATAVVRDLTGFDRVMVYQFDRDWNGRVVGESLAEGVEPWLGLRYPASDIPAQARAMYVHSRTRLIADVNYEPVPVLPVINPETGGPIDLTHAVNRSVSPVHLQYLRNMGVAASMSVSIVRDKQLWGLILAHHREPRHVGYRTRIACDALAQQLSLQISVRENSRNFGKALELKSMQPRLLAAMTGAPDLFDGLAANIDEICRLGGGDGIAVCMDRIRLHGETPTPEQTSALVDWIAGQSTDDVFQTDALPLIYPPAVQFKQSASGMLAISLSRTRRWFVLWFRQEVLRARYWAGDPKKPVEFTANGMVIKPRSDFARWKQTLEMHGIDWEPHHVDAVADFRNAAVGVVLRQAEERARLSNELERSNRELEAFSYSVSHDLRAPFRHIVGFSELLMKRNRDLDSTSQRYLSTIMNAARFAGTLVDSLLTFSQMGRAAMRVTRVELNDIIADVRAELADEIGNRPVEWSVDRLPPVAADPMMVRIVVRNLLSNAVKYSRDSSPPRIRVRYCGVESEAVAAPVATESGMKAAAGGPLLAFDVTDNGVGFDMRYVDKLFGVFQRLHKAEEFEGTGIGLANVRRIVERHGGRVRATGETGAGASFRFSLPGWEAGAPTGGH